MKTLQERKDKILDYLTLLVADNKLTTHEAGTIIAALESCVMIAEKESFEAGMTAANKAYEQTSEFLNQKIK